MEIRSKTRNHLPAFLAISLAVLFATIGCSLSSPPATVGELRTRHETVAVGEADAVQVEISMAAGELIVGGGASDLLDADFTYNVDELEPEVEYSADRLVVRTPQSRIGIGSWADLADYRYQWDLRFSDDVPMEMKVEVAAGKADLELSSLRLTSLDIETGASQVTVNLSGSPSLARLDMEAGAALVVVDLSGTWADDLDARISSGLGGLTVRLPRTICARVEVEAALSDVSASGLTKAGGVYTNDACGQSEVTLRIAIDAGVGDVNLEVEE